MNHVYRPGDLVEFRPPWFAGWCQAEFVHRCTEPGATYGTLAVRVRRRGRRSRVLIGLRPDDVRPIR